MDLEPVHSFQDDQLLEFNKALPQSTIVGTFNSKAFVRYSVFTIYRKLV